MFNNSDKSSKVFPQNQRLLFNDSSNEKPSTIKPAFSFASNDFKGKPQNDPFINKSLDVPDFSDCFCSNNNQNQRKPIFDERKTSLFGVPNIHAIVANFQKELKERDRRIQNLQTQVKTLSNALNMAITLFTQNKQKIYEPNNKDQLQNQKQKVKANTLSVLGPISMIGSQVIHEDMGYKMHRPLNEDLSKAIDVKIENNYGKIIFKQPINLYQVNKRISECIKIQNSNIKVIDDSMKNKKCQILLYNFQGYLEVSINKRQQIIKFVQNMMTQNNQKMQVIEFNDQMGNLYLRSSGI